MSKKEIKKPISIRFSQADEDHLSTVALAEGRTVAALVRHATLLYLAARGVGSLAGTVAQPTIASAASPAETPARVAPVVSAPKPADDHRFDHLSDKPEPGNRYSPRDRAILQSGRW